MGRIISIKISWWYTGCMWSDILAHDATQSAVPRQVHLSSVSLFVCCTWWQRLKYFENNFMADEPGLSSLCYPYIRDFFPKEHPRNFGRNTGGCVAYRKNWLSAYKKLSYLWNGQSFYWGPIGSLIRAVDLVRKSKILEGHYAFCFKTHASRCCYWSIVSYSFCFNTVNGYHGCSASCRKAGVAIRPWPIGTWSK